MLVAYRWSLMAGGKGWLVARLGESGKAFKRRGRGEQAQRAQRKALMKKR